MIMKSESVEFASHILKLTFCHSESPYAEVRAAVSNTDDPNMPVNTFRMWFIGIIITIIVSAINQFFVMRCE